MAKPAAKDLDSDDACADARALGRVRPRTCARARSHEVDRVAAVVAELDSVVLLPFLLPLPRPVLFSYIFAASFVLWTVKLLIATVVKFWYLLVLQELLLVQQALEWAFLLTLPDHNHSNEHALVD